MSRKTIERQARQRFVLDAARRVFASKGVENATMEDIADASEYTRRTLYAYFRSRDEICLLVFIEDMVARWAEQQNAIAGVNDGLAKVLAFGTSFYDFARRNRHSMRLHLYWDMKGVDRSRVSEEAFSNFEKTNNELAEGLRDIFQLGVRDGSLRPDLQVDICISQYLYSLRSILNRALSEAYSFASFEADEYVKHYLDMFSRAIRNFKGNNP